jgi:hypothetical protein
MTYRFKTRYYTNGEIINIYFIVQVQTFDTLFSNLISKLTTNNHKFNQPGMKFIKLVIKVHRKSINVLWRGLKIRFMCIKYKKSNQFLRYVFLILYSSIWQRIFYIFKLFMYRLNRCNHSYDWNEKSMCYRMMIWALKQRGMCMIHLSSQYNEKNIHSVGCENKERDASGFMFTSLHIFFSLFPSKRLPGCFNFNLLLSLMP